MVKWVYRKRDDTILGAVLVTRGGAHVDTLALVRNWVRGARFGVALGDVRVELHFANGLAQ